MSYHPDAAAEHEREQMDIRAGYRRFIRRALDTSDQAGDGDRPAETREIGDSVTLDRQPCSCPAPGR